MIEINFHRKITIIIKKNMDKYMCKVIVGFQSLDFELSFTF